MEVWPGNAYPLGATFDGSGTNFSLFSEAAESVELCLFGARGRETRVVMPENDGYVWHCYLPSVQPGQRYGYRVHGPYDPTAGQRCNPNKLLLDPYAKAVSGDFRWNNALFSYPLGDADAANRADAMDTADSARYMPKAVVINPYFDWTGDIHPRIRYDDTIIYEAHVKGLTMRHPDLPAEIRGTYAGIAHPAVVDHLTRLGVTAIELMPVHQFVQDSTLKDKGLANYWGYNTIGFFAPHNAYCSAGDTGGQVQEFKAMVKVLHSAGIEVILDVVYNHTAEGNQLGPTLSFRGIDNVNYYRLVDGQPEYYMDYTGTGNSLNVRHPHSLQLIMDSLRYWVTEMHVDGFRFDLAAALAREFYDVDRLSSFFELVQQDPIVSQVKLIAEPWDVGPGGYQVGNFPPQWTEWNGKYRDTVRDFWRGEPATLGEFASRLTGSADLYEQSGRRPVASINFVTAHDGFTLRDLVSYNEKHNEANREGNNDGANDNRSWNSGAEGPTDDPAVLALRARQQRNFLTTLLLSQGVPMVLHGDELGRTQQGNNNAYCQDSPLTWIDWEHADTALVEFTAAVVRLRRHHPTFRRRRFFDRSPGRARRRRATARRGDDDPVGQLDAGPGLGLRIRALHRGVPQRAGNPWHRRTWSADRRRLLPVAVQRTRRRPGIRPAAGGVQSRLAAGDRHLRDLTRFGHLPGRRSHRGGRQGHGGADGRVGGATGRTRHPSRGRRPSGSSPGRPRGAVARPQRARQSADRPELTRGPIVSSARAGRQRIPASTYRLQVTPTFGLRAAAEVVPYLHRLGVDWVYLSPLLEAQPGSDHGYDVVDHGRTDTARGGRAGLRHLADTAHGSGMGVLADLVPNHVGIATPADSVWWWELLRDGPDAKHSDAFDVDWAAGGRIRLPVLGDDPAELDELVLQDDTLRYHEHVFPVADGTAGGTPRDVHDRQHYELVNFRTADHDLNYRRFFAVNSLAGIRVDLPEIFAASHVEIGYWLEQGWVDGLRVDHPDGLRRSDPIPARPRDADRRRVHPGGEDPGAGRRTPCRLGMRRHHRVRHPRTDRPTVRRPGGGARPGRPRRALARWSVASVVRPGA